MQVYLVGGAVRDSVLNRPITERDYVVVGTTPEQMLALGFTQVGADFPVFLHPITHDEYALARTERKTGNGYHGFSIHTKPDVSLEEDLIRRDLTINAMAIEVNGLFDSQVKTGEIIDPYHGLNDIKNRTLRHVSPAFTEDPVRVLRLARFYARYAPLGFSIAEQTIDLTRKMRDAGELNHLVAERVWAETHKALSEKSSDSYFDSLATMGILGAVMPSLSMMLDEAKYNGNWEVIGNSLQLANREDNLLKFALLSLVFVRFDSQFVDLDFFSQFCQSLKVPKNYQLFAEFLLKNFKQLQNFNQLPSDEIFDLIAKSGWLKEMPTLEDALTCTMIYQTAKQQVFLHHAKNTLNNIKAKDVDTNLTGKAIGEAILQKRRLALTDMLQNFNKNVL